MHAPGDADEFLHERFWVGGVSIRLRQWRLALQRPLVAGKCYYYYYVTQGITACRYVSLRTLRCVTMCVYMSLRVTLCLTMCAYVSLRVTTCHYVVTTCHYVSLRVTTCLTLCAFVTLSNTTCHYLELCLSPYASVRLTMCKYVSLYPMSHFLRYVGLTS